MKAISIFLLFFVVTSSGANAQIADDVYYKAPKLNSDSGNSAVSKIGLYISVGPGRININSLPPSVAELDVFGLIASASVAYKSHVVSITTTGGSSFPGGLEHESAFGNSYVAFLVGESLRQKNCFISLNIGIAMSSMKFGYEISNREYENYNFEGISFPIEFKTFVLANEVVGVGVHFYHNINRDYSTSFISISLVMGNWNKF